MFHEEQHNEREIPRHDSTALPAEQVLPTISLVHVPHGRIPNLYQCCYEYVEPWDWSAVSELVETGRWFFDREQEAP